MVEQLAPEDLVDDWSDLSTSDLGPGSRLGRYELLLPIAFGGMARVWAARMVGTRGFSKLVAIKTILPHLARDPEFERMFLDEARIAAGVHHPNVCEIYELGEEGHALYLAMEWVNGESLVHMLRAQKKAPVPIDPRIAARICADACAGLHAAHNLLDEDGRPLNVVHRDVSPHNILVSIDGNVKVADFGVAKAYGQIHQATVAGQIKGKVAYMSPEQITGAPVDRRSDIYAMGCVLYEATVGTQPFRGDNDPQIMQSVLKGHYAMPRVAVRGYPPELETILTRTLSADPRRRFSDAEQMRVALEEWLVRSGPIVTPSQVAAVVKERAGAEIEKRREHIKRASNPSDKDASWPGKHGPAAGAGHTPSAARRGGQQQSQSGVVPAGAAAAATPSAPAAAPLARHPSFSSFQQQQLPPTPQPHGAFALGPQAPPAAAHVPMPPATVMVAPQPFPGPHAASPHPGAHAPGGYGPGHAPGYGPGYAPPPAAPHAPQQGYQPPPPLGTTQPGSKLAHAAPGRKGGYLLAGVIGVVAAGALLGGGLVLYKMLDAKTPPVATSTVTTPATTAAATATETPQAIAPSATASAAAPARDVRFDVAPTDAVMSVDGVAQAATVRTVPRPAAGKTVVVVVRAPGYIDETVKVGSDAPEQPIPVILVPSSTPSATTTTTAAPWATYTGRAVPTATATAKGELPPNPYDKQP